jgi:hypothetical protein
MAGLSAGGSGSGPGWAGPTAPPWSVLALLPEPFRPWIKNYFAYATSYLTLASAGTATNTIAIQSDAYFVATSATMIVSDSTNATAYIYRPITVQIYDTSAGMNLFTQAIGCDEFFGDATQPGNLAFPYIFRPGGAIQVTLANLISVALNVRCTLHGFKAIPNSDQETQAW